MPVFVVLVEIRHSTPGSLLPDSCCWQLSWGPRILGLGCCHFRWGWRVREQAWCRHRRCPRGGRANRLRCCRASGCRKRPSFS